MPFPDIQVDLAYEQARACARTPTRRGPCSSLLELTQNPSPGFLLPGRTGPDGLAEVVRGPNVSMTFLRVFLKMP